MKITTPDICIEATAQEIIELLDYFSTGRSYIEVNEANDASLNEIDELAKKHPEFFVDNDEQPEITSDEFEPMPEPEEEKPATTIAKDEQEGIKKQKKKAVGQTEKDRKDAAVNRGRDKDYRWEKRKVDVKVDQEWYTFNSVNEAAKFIGCAHNNLSTALQAGKDTYRGHEIRYHVSDEQNQPELDACLAEIAARNKEPYQPDNKK